MQGTISSSPGKTPNYNLYRIVTATDGAGELTKRGNGINCQGKRVACIQLVPINVADVNAKDPWTGVALGTSNPTAKIRFWNEALARFVEHQPAIALTAPGAGVPIEMTVAVEGRLMFVEVTGGVTAGQAVAIFVGTSDIDESI